jgi:penicillin-binding protein 2
MDKSRKFFVILLCLILLGIIFITRLYFLQIVDTSNYYKAQAYGSNEIIIHPPRGTILDRKGQLLVFNDALYDLMVVPDKTIDTDMDAMCRELNIDTTNYKKRIKKASRYNSRQASVFYKNLPYEIFTRLQEVIHQYPAFYVEEKIDRRYNINGAAHLLGYLGEVSEKVVKDQPYYKPGDIMGIAGMEKSYEVYLRGIKGRRVVLVDKFSRQQGSFANGKFDSLPISGQNIISSIDIDLQKFGEQLLTNKIGSIVAIEPQTGEILSIVNSPNYDPNLLVGQERNKNFSRLLLDPQKPLFNRALKAPYPPGSTFKVVQALIGLQEGVIDPSSRFPCAGGYRMGNLKVGCHAHASPLDLENSIKNSCNAYYCHLYRGILDNPKYNSVQDAYDKWTEYLRSFGIGIKIGIDLPEESSGIIKKKEYFAKVFGKNWRSANVVSMSIGQGEVGLTPLQMANVAAIVANKGWFITPHVVKNIGDNQIMLNEFREKRKTMIDKHHFDTIISGMSKVCLPGGTAGRTSIPGISICGKTGTAQNPHGKDHSIFIAFAPRENPKIAICVIVENGGFGASFAAPIANLMIERYLKTNKESPSLRLDLLERMMKSSLLEPIVPKPITN